MDAAEDSTHRSNSPCLGDGGRWPSSLRLQHELILQAAGEGIYGLDLRGRVTFANPAAARMTGHTLAELMHQPMHDLVHHTRRNGGPYPQRACPIYAAFRDGLVRHVEDDLFWRKDGTSFPIAYTSTPLFHEGRLLGAVVVFRDISERKEAERQLRHALDEVRRLKERLQAEDDPLQQEIHHVHNVEAIIGSSTSLRRVMADVQRVADTHATVLIQGESGTGKELVARAVHGLSRRAKRPLVKVNCGALPAALVESELFGHERGAFTGAIAQRLGRFERAHGGTLLLDEVGELPWEVQSALLRVLQEREFERVGGGQTIKVDVRILAATSRDLSQRVAQGRFRQDLFFRLNVFPITVPPLRERPSDIPELVEACLGRLRQRLRRPIADVSPEGMRRLMAYAWPGNVRELNNVLERAAIVSQGPWLDLTGMAPPAPDRLLEGSASDEGETLRGHERRHILAALARCDGKIAGRDGAAARLGLHPNTLRSRMQRLGIPFARMA